MLILYMRCACGIYMKSLGKDLKGPYTTVGTLGFALAKGLIRGLTRYPNPSSL